MNDVVVIGRRGLGFALALLATLLAMAFSPLLFDAPVSVYGLFLAAVTAIGLVIHHRT